MRFVSALTVHRDLGRHPHAVRHTVIPILSVVAIGLIILLISTSAMAQGSCQGVCGAQSEEGCWCDEGCEAFGDCCPDRAQVCGAASCQGACGGRSEAGCWCDDGCEAFGDCCPDRAQVCMGGGQPEGPDVPNIAYCTDVTMWAEERRTLESQVLTLVNERRAQGADCRTAGNFEPAPPLTMNPNLRCAARKHSKDMVERNYFDHTSPDGEGVGERVMQAEYNYRAFGENIAAGNATAAETVAQWMDSDRHCSNIMRGEYTELGVGYFPGGEFGHTWTQVFGTPPAQ